MPPKPKEDPLGPAHFPVTEKEVADFLTRMEEVSGAVTGFLHEPAGADEERRKQREERRRQEAIEADKERRRRRYNTEYFTRYDKDEVIDKLLAEVEMDEASADEAARAAAAAKRKKQLAELSSFEKLTLEQAEKQKAAGNDKVKAAKFDEAFDLYDNALGMNPPDDALVLALHNNRAMVSVKLRRWQQAVEDASFVLAREKYNVKALLRRARALLELHRPSDALADVDRALRAEGKNLEAKELQREALREQEEVSWADRVRADRPGDVDKLVEATDNLRGLSARFASTLERKKVKPAAAAAEEADGEAPDAAGASASPAAAATGAAQPVIQIATDEEVDGIVEEVTIALCQVGALVSDAGMRTVFRIAGGLSHLRSLLMTAENAIGLTADAQKATGDDERLHARVRGTPAGVVLVSSLFRTYARTLDTPTALAVAVDDAASMNVLFEASATIASEVAPGKAGQHAMLAAAAGTLVLAVIAAEGRMAKRVWTAIRDRLRITKWIDGWALDPRSLDALRAVEHLLRHDELRGDVAGAHGWEAVALDAICAVVEKDPTTGTTVARRANKGSAGFKASPSRDSAASLLGRLSAVPQWLRPFADDQGVSADARRDTVLGKVAMHAADALSQMAEGSGDAAVAHAFMAEAMLAVLHNVAITAQRRPQVATAVDKHKMGPLMLVQIKRAIEEGVDKYDALNVAARCLNLTGKLVLVSKELEAECAAAVPQLLKWLKATPGERATTLEREYVDTCVENAALTIASIVSRGVAAKACAITIAMASPADGIAPVLGLIKSGQPRAAGNAAMILSHLPENAYDEVVSVAATIVDFALVFLNRIVALRSDMHELERSGKRDSPDWAAAKGAKRNVAISLSKYCKDERIMQQVRDNRGIEILYSALGEEDKQSATRFTRSGSGADGTMVATKQ